MAWTPRDPNDFTPPSLEELQRALGLQWQYFSPRFFGLENVRPGSKMLFVGNHTIFGMLDSPLMQLGIYKETGVFPRALGDRVHFYVPGWRDRLQRWGGVEGTPENCARLMENGWPVLVFPGGGREVMKNKGEAYQLIWKQRTGFARMAMQYGYDIIPFAAVGAEDAYTIRYDANDFRASLLGRALDKTGVMRKYMRNGDNFAPIVTGIGPTRLPRPERMYFKFGKPIPTLAYMEKSEDKEAQWEVRRKVENAVTGMMDELKEIRAADKDYSWLRKKLIHRKIG